MMRRPGRPLIGEQPLTAAQRAKRYREQRGKAKPLTMRQIAKARGVSERYLHHAKSLSKDAIDEWWEAVQSGSVSVSTLADICHRCDDEMQRQLFEQYRRFGWPFVSKLWRNYRANERA